MAQGAGASPPNATGLLTTCCTSITVGSADFTMATYFNAGIARRIIPQGAGDVYLKRPGDSVNWTRYTVLASVPIEGEITDISGTTSNAGATTMRIVLEF